MNRRKNEVQYGNSVSVHYRGTLSDGTEFDNSKVRGQALNFQVGAGQMIPGFDKALVGMTVGETRNPKHCLLYTSPSPRDRQKSRMPSSA